MHDAAIRHESNMRLICMLPSGGKVGFLQKVITFVLKSLVEE